MTPARARKRILLVDDSSTVLTLERMILQEHFDLLTARDGEEAVAQAVAHHPDLILMDVVMPRMSGIAACQAIRGREETRGIPIIMVTSRGGEDALEIGYESGCSDYVTKPINGLELLAKIRNHLDN